MTSTFSQMFSRFFPLIFVAIFSCTTSYLSANEKEQSSLPLVELSLEDPLITPNSEEHQATLLIPRLEKDIDIHAQSSIEATGKSGNRTLEKKSLIDYKTDFRFGYTDKGIYFWVVNHFNPKQELSARATVHDDQQIWNDDSDVLIFESPDRGIVFRADINPNGATIARFGRLSLEQEAWQSNVVLDKEKGIWQVAGFIPFESLQLTQPPADIKVNFGRNIPSKGTLSFVEPFALLGNGRFVFEGIEPKSDDSSLGDRSFTVRADFVHQETVAGERWLNGKVFITGDKEKILKTKLLAKVLFPNGYESSETIEVPVTNTNGNISVNVKDFPTMKGELRLELEENGKVVASDIVVLGKGELGTPLKPGQQIPVHVDMTEKFQLSSSAVTFGVAFAPGQLWVNDGFLLVDKEGHSYPSQIETTGEWFRDGSIKWLRVDAIVPTGKDLFLEYRPGAVSPKGPELKVVTLEDGKIQVSTGGQTYLLGKGKSPIEKIIYNNKEVATDEGARGLYVIDQQDRIGNPSEKDTKITVESTGPIEASIKFEGPYVTKDGEELARYIMRAEFYAGNPEARITHTFIVSQHTDDLWFKEIGLELSVAAGASEQAWLGVDRLDWQAVEKISFGDKNVEQVSILQNDHYHYLRGKNEFTISGQNKSGSSVFENKVEGEIGGWAALVGTNAGLMIANKDAASLYPKEFIVSKGKINLLLFSPNAEMELDFKLESRAKDLDFLSLVGKTVKRVAAEKGLEIFLKHKNDALGWARTHDIVICPLVEGTNDVKAIAQASGALNFPIYAYGSPEWIAESGVIGDVQAYDPRQFPEVEAAVDLFVRDHAEFLEKMGDFGILDYGSGPHFIKDRKAGIPMLRRWTISYGFKDNLWFLYARRGDRFLREFAQRAGRHYGDAYRVNWDDPKNNKFRGFYIRAEGGDGSIGETPFNFPINWGSSSNTDNGGTTDLNKHLLDYYLTGYRRGRDVAEGYEESLLKYYTPQMGQRAWRRFRFLGDTTQVYALNWNPKIRAIAENIIGWAYDSTGAVKVDVSKAYGSTYKTQSDFKVILRSYEQLRDPRLKEMLDQLAEYWSYSLNQYAFDYDPPWGPVASYLYHEKKDVSMGVYASLKLKGMLDKEARDAGGFGAPAMTTFMMNGFAWMEKVLLETGAMERLPAGFSGINALGNSFRWIFKHGELVQDEFRYSFTNPNSVFRGAGVPTFIQTTSESPSYANNLHSVYFTSATTGRIVVPPDTPSNEFEIVVTSPGTHTIMTNHRFPLVLNIEGYWRPTTSLPIFFSVGEEDKDARIFFADEASIMGPNGKSLEGVAPGKWVSLTEPGMYQFHTRGIVNGENFPPFYAFGEESFYFIPTHLKSFQFEPKTLDIGEIASSDISEKGINLPIEHLFPEGKLPPAGTIEFFYQPAMDAVESDKTMTLLRVESSDKKVRPLSISYQGNSERLYSGRPYLLAGIMPVLDTSGPQTNIVGVRPYRSWMFRKGTWNHIAIVWDPEGINHVGKPTTVMRMFVNGEAGQHFGDPYVWNAPIQVDHPTNLVIGRGMPGKIGGLRVSDEALYKGDFSVPSPSQIQGSESTRGIMDFSNDRWITPTNDNTK